MNIETIKDILSVDPQVKEYDFDEQKDLDLKMIEYIFESEEEMLMVQYIKEQNKIWNVFYNDKNNNAIYTVTNESLVDHNKQLHTGIIAYVDDFAKQRELLNYINK